MSLVLVADDEPAVLEVLTEVVEDLGHDVLRAHDGREALALARAKQPNLVVTDHMMPRLSGVELCRALRKDEQLREVPVILLSAALPREASEASAWLAKPFELDEFESLVKRTLEGVAGAGGGAQAAPGALQGLAPKIAPQETPPDRFIHWIAHEMKTPLAAARANMQLLERRLSQTGGVAVGESAHYRAVMGQLEKMEQTINALMDAGRLSEGRLTLALETCDMREPVRQAVEPLRELHPDFQIDLLLPEGPLRAEVDPERIRQVVGNLVTNAIRYGAPPKHVRVSLSAADGQPQVRVQDFGQGISYERQKDLFARFRAPEEGRGKGHGVGLFLASELTRLHGGKLEVDSQPGQGATFTLVLPPNEGRDRPRPPFGSGRRGPNLALLPS